MKISYNWLKDYVDHPLSPGALGERLTMGGLELEDVQTLGASLEGVVVGRVLAVRPHPNADRLTLCRVDVGNGAPLQIACGAPNVAAGQKVPVATVGTTLRLPSRAHPGQKEAIQITKAKLRGEVSEGMICAEDELGLSDDHAGIMVLREDAEVGRPFEAYLARQGLAAADTVLDLAVTPNRPDATSHLGVARDVAALTDAPVTRPDVPLPEPGGAAAAQVAVEIRCPEDCHRYVALLLRGVAIRESPPWLQQRLRAIGLRPINNVVDVTNYVMYECGQPLHAFDFDRVEGARIVVRRAEEGERFTTLDGKTHTLPAGVVLICDAARPVALGGIMGGENSEVSPETTNVLIESAYFDPSVTRRSAKALGITSDASYRFERGVDADGQVWAAARAAQLMTALGGGHQVPGMVDAHPTTTQPRVLALRPARIARILGVEIPKDEAARILTALGFAVEDDAAEAVLRCTVPTFRPDVEREIDLIEEVARIYGYERIPEPTHATLPHFVPRAEPAGEIRRAVHRLMQGFGYREFYTNSILPREDAERFNRPVLGSQGAVVETLNPISQEMTTLRPSLLPEVLKAMAFNRNHGQDVLRCYELGHVFYRTDRADGPVPGYAEHEAFLLAAAGPDAPTAWDRPPRPVDFFDVKGAVEGLLEALRIPDVAMTPVYESTPVTAYHLAVTAAGRRLGVVARLADALADELDLKTPVYFAELDFEALTALATPGLERVYQPVSRYPVVERDLAVVVDRAQEAGPMQATIRAAGQPLLRQVGIFDLYEGEGIEAGRKSVAFSLRFGAERTLTDAEVDAAITAILQALEQAHDAVLRT